MVEKKEMGSIIVDSTLDGFRKRDGHLVPFNQEKITNAICKALEEIDNKNTNSHINEDAMRISNEVIKRLNDSTSPYYVKRESGKRIADLEFIQNLVELVFAEFGFVEAMVTFKNYRLKRQNARNQLRIRTKVADTGKDTTKSHRIILIFIG